MTYSYVSALQCLDFAGTFEAQRPPAPEESLTEPRLLSDWALQAGLLDSAIDVNDKQLATVEAFRARQRAARSGVEAKAQSRPELS